jgi:hypothetical protein
MHKTLVSTTVMKGRTYQGQTSSKSVSSSVPGSVYVWNSPLGDLVVVSIGIKLLL